MFLICSSYSFCLATIRFISELDYIFGMFYNTCDIFRLLQQNKNETIVLFWSWIKMFCLALLFAFAKSWTKCTTNRGYYPILWRSIFNKSFDRTYQKFDVSLNFENMCNYYSYDLCITISGDYFMSMQGETDFFAYRNKTKRFHIL